MNFGKLWMGQTFNFKSIILNWVKSKVGHSNPASIRYAMWKRYEKTMIENSNIQNFIFVSLQLDRHIITEFDKMKIDIYAIRIFTFYLLKISFSLNHQHFLNFRLDLICWVRSKADSKKVWIMNRVRKVDGTSLYLLEKRIHFKSVCLFETLYRPLLDLKTVHFGEMVNKNLIFRDWTFLRFNFS